MPEDRKIIPHSEAIGKLLQEPKPQSPVAMPIPFSILAQDVLVHCHARGWYIANGFAIVDDGGKQKVRFDLRKGGNRRDFWLFEKDLKDRTPEQFVAELELDI
jgi:hypothetical protein